MKGKTKVELTAESLKAVIDEKCPSSLTRLSHEFGYKGSVSGSLAKKFRALLPGIDAMLEGTANSNGKPETMVGNGKGAKNKTTKGAVAAKGKPIAKEIGKWPRDPRNVFRPGAYGTCFDILARHPTGLQKEKLIELLAEATGKDVKHAAFDAQVLLSAKANDNGLSNNDSPRHRSCRPGFWVRRENGHVQLMLD